MKLAQKRIYRQYGETIVSGVKGIFTMHGRTLEDLKCNFEVNELIENKQIEKIIFI